MAKIRAVDFANYVESSKNLAVFVANSKNISASSKDNLKNVINKFNQLEALDDSDSYIPDPYFVTKENEYLNDPLRQKNGGEYLYCNYYILTDKYASTQVSARSIIGNTSNPTRLVTSDGQEIINTTTSTSTSNDKIINWAEGHYDGILEDGTKVRWIKIYTSYGSQSYVPSYGENETTSTFGGLGLYGSTIFAIIDSNINLTGSGSSSNSYNVMYTPLKYLILGDNVTTWEGGYFDNCYIDCIKNLSNSIEGLKILGYNKGPAILKHLDLKINSIYSLNVTGTRSRTSYCGLKKLDLSNSSLEIPSTGYLQTGGFGKFYTHKIYFPSEGKNFPGFDNYSNDFKNFVIPTITEEQNFPIILNCPNLENLEVSNDFNVSLELKGCYMLLKNSCINIFNNLRDLSNTDAKTIILPLRLSFELTDEDLDIATNKNWTITFQRP